MAGFMKRLRVCLPTIIVLGAPLVLLPLILPFDQTSQESKCAYLLLLMAIYWITESLPLPVTALLPFPLAPLLGLASSKYLCKFFIKDLTFLIIGGIMVAVGIEECHLHKRIALRFLMLIGVQPRRLLLGIMLITAFLSMWISNTATTAMMMPIMRAILAKLFVTSREESADKFANERGDAMEMEVRSSKEYGKSAGSPVTLSKNSPKGFEMEILVTDGKVGELTYILQKDEDLINSSLDNSGAICSFDDAIDQMPSLTHHHHHHHHHHYHHHHHLHNPHHENNNNNNSLHHRRHVNGVEKLRQTDSTDEEEKQLVRGEAAPPKTAHNGASFTSCAVSEMAVVVEQKQEPKKTEKRQVFVYDYEMVVAAPLEQEAVMASLDEKERGMLKAFSLCVCYSANFGGIATLTGTPPNMILSGLVNDSSGFPVITFMSWLVYGFPLCVVGLVLMYLWMNVYMYGVRDTLLCKSASDQEQVTRTRQAIQQEYKKLGEIKFSEIMVFVHFIVLVTLWLTRQSVWSSVFEKGYVSDSVPAILLGVSLFVFANQMPNVFCFRKKGDPSSPRAMPSVLSWKQFSHKFPFGVIFLLGGGFVLAEICRKTGLTQVIASYLMFVSSIPLWAAGVLVTALASLVTEITSNTVIAILVLPILKDIATAMEVNPLFLMLPAAVATSLAFMLPVATPPNALVFAYGDLKVQDMMKCGVVLNLIGIGTIILGTYTWGYTYFSLGSFPSWAQPATTLAPDTQDAVNATVSVLQYAVSSPVPNVTMF